MNGQSGINQPSVAEKGLLGTIRVANAWSTSSGMNNIFHHEDSHAFNNIYECIMNETTDMIANCVFQNNGRINEQFQLMKLNF